MRNYFYSTVFALALITAYAVSQTGSYPSSNPPSNQPQSGATKTPDASQSTSPSSNAPESQKGTEKSMPQSDQAAPTVDDPTLQSKIHEQLATNTALANVTVTVKDGVATLEGKVASKQDRKDAKKLTEAVPGVKSVKDKLTVETSNNPANPPSSHWMAPQSTGSSNGSSSAPQSSPSTTPPSTTPSGTASQETAATSGNAQSPTQTGSGTPQSGATQSGSGTASGMPQSDANAGSTDNGTLQTQIQTAIKNEPTLSNDSIMVSVTDSAIDLSGTATTKKEKQTAKRIAQSYANNRKVQDHITVSGSESNSMPQSDKTDKTTPHKPEKSDKNPSQTPPDQTVPH